MITLGQIKSDNNKYKNINQEDIFVSWLFFWKIDHTNRMKTLNENHNTFNDNTNWLWSQKVASTVYEMSKIFLIEYVSYCSPLKTISFEKSLAKIESFAFSDKLFILEMQEMTTSSLHHLFPI